VIDDPLEHPANAALFDVLRMGAGQRSDGSYEERTHPDLADWLGELAGGLDTELDRFFGVPVLRTRAGVAFAYAFSTGAIVYREPPGGFARSLPAPRWSYDVPPGWVATEAFLGSRMDWTVRDGDAAERERCRAAAAAAMDL
jgi:hypothetical protein